jgi:hypothetical protein
VTAAAPLLHAALLPQRRCILCSRTAMGCDLGSCRLLWPASFLLGIAVFAPLEALVLCIDYYSESFPVSGAHWQEVH